MLKSYFEIIRHARSENRQKQDGVYYEAHHIIPDSFDKKSTVVLLTAEEHYKAHKLLAEAFTGHFLYGQKMLWAFHRMTYNNGRKITEQEYAEARQLLMPLWKREKTSKHRDNIGKAHKNKKWVLNIKTGEFLQIDPEELHYYLDKGWINTNKQKGIKRSEETKKKCSISATKRMIGKTGENSQASKGTVVCENIETGEKIEAGSALQLSKALGNVHFSVIHEVLNSSNKPKSKASKYYNFLQTHKIYYK